MTTKKLVEGASLKSKSGKFRIRLISEGVGSSGTYPGDVLERDGAVAFPAGTHIFFDHLTESDEWERSGNHSIRDLVGVTLTDAEWDAQNRSLDADAKFYSNHRDFIEEAKDDIGLSVEASGIVQEGVVESLVASPLNAISVVPRAGRDGKITQLLESYREKQNDKESDKLSENNSSGHRKDKGMTPEEIKALQESLAKTVADAVSAMTVEIKEALAPAKPVENEETEAPKVSEVAEAIATSGLPESARKRVYEAIENTEDADVTALIEAEKAYIEQVKESLKETEDENPGRVREAASKTETDLVVGAWA